MYQEIKWLVNVFLNGELNIERREFRIYFIPFLLFFSGEYKALSLGFHITKGIGKFFLSKHILLDKKLNFR